MWLFQHLENVTKPIKGNAQAYDNLNISYYCEQSYI